MEAVSSPAHASREAWASSKRCCLHRQLRQTTAATLGQEPGNEHALEQDHGGRGEASPQVLLQEERFLKVQDGVTRDRVRVYAPAQDLAPVEVQGRRA